jgi:hypothetical protein
MIIDADPHEVVGDRNGQRGGTRRGAHEVGGAEIDVEVFDLGAPVVIDGVFQAGAGGPADLDSGSTIGLSGSKVVPAADAVDGAVLYFFSSPSAIEWMGLSLLFSSSSSSTTRAKAINSAPPRSALAPRGIKVGRKTIVPTEVKIRITPTMILKPPKNLIIPTIGTTTSSVNAPAASNNTALKFASLVATELARAPHSKACGLVICDDLA